ncbi:hypothetical protein NL53_20670 [Vibrio variabilis]|uniref:Uncharacterized protein n=1 Tax=Vibrio variabilis TaxID=990271 RepID=A0ABR4Y5U8_9VIBR|nr:hypothetical protein [Vibrio variabilis]KHA58656.1 hypothetical protein NL53_20670 [Vibrio variabilis]
MNKLLRYKSIIGWGTLLLTSSVFFLLGLNFVLPVLDSDGYHQLSKLISQNPALELIIDINATVIEKIILAGSFIVFSWSGLLFLYAYKDFSLKTINQIGQLLEYFKGSFVYLTSSFSALMLGAVVKSLYLSGHWDIWWISLVTNLTLLFLSLGLKKWKIFKIQIKPSGHLEKHPKCIAWCVFAIAFMMFFGSTIYPEIALLIDLYQLLVLS